MMFITHLFILVIDQPLDPVLVCKHSKISTPEYFVHRHGYGSTFGKFPEQIVGEFTPTTGFDFTRTDLVAATLAFPLLYAINEMV